MIQSMDINPILENKTIGKAHLKARQDLFKKWLYSNDINYDTTSLPWFV